MLTRNARSPADPSATGPDAVGASTPSDSGLTGTAGWRDLSLGNLAVVLLAFLLPVVWSSQVYNWFASPKSALALVALGPGLVVLVWLVARRDRSAIAAAAFLAVAGVSTAVAHEPMMSLFGEYFAQNGLLLTAACVALWALGRTLDYRGRPLLVLALIAAAVVNAAVAWLQMSTDLGIEALLPVQGRANGLMGNPIQLAALCVAVLWLVAARERDAARPLASWTMVVFLAGAVELSGSRIGTVLVLAVLAWHAVAHVRRSQVVRAGGVLAAGVIGVLLATAIGTSSGTTGRVTEAGASGLGTRVEIWESAIGALQERPLFGFGPGRYQSVSTPLRTLEVARYEGPDVLYSDAHNLLVEYVVATGIVGAVLLGAWVVLSARRSRGPLAGFCALAAIVGLLQPQYVGITPLIALALGGAMARAPNPRFADAPPLAGRIAVASGAVFAIVGLLAGISLLVGDTHYARAHSHRSMSELDAASHWMPPWPQLPALGADIVQLPGGQPPRAALAFEREAIARDQQDPRYWYTLGSLQFLRDDFDGAGTAYGKALELNPWSFYGLAGSYRVSLERGDLAAAREWRSKLCRLGPTDCPPLSELESSIGGADR